MIRRIASAVLWLMACLPIGLLGVWSVSRRWPWPALLPTRWQITAWSGVLGTAGLGPTLLRSVAISTSVALGASIAGFLTSRSLARHARRQGLYVFLHLPFVISPVVLGVSLDYLFLRLGVAERMSGVILGQGIVAYAYAVILLSAFWNERISAYADGASTLGATEIQVWTRVLWPIARPLLAVCLLQTFLISWFDFALVLLIGGGRVATLTTSLYQYFASGDVRLAAACALLLVAPPLLALLLHRYARSNTFIDAGVP